MKMNKMHESNRACWNEWAQWWGKRADEKGNWKRCHRDPALVFCPDEMAFLSDVRGKDVCVLGSGDNEAVFALAGLGARVTSVDISEGQLAIAAERARILGLSVSFVRADVTHLEGLEAGRFDLAYTGGHVSVWVSDITRYYAEAARILRQGGLLIINEYHPVRQMWLDSPGPEPRHRYLHRGPYEDRSPKEHAAVACSFAKRVAARGAISAMRAKRTGGGVAAREDRPQFEFHWTVADHIQAVLDAGCALVKVIEYGEGKENEDYSKATPAELPMYLFIVARKEPFTKTPASLPGR